jgi:NDP-4-keto-2,6-dideoxyhexose 3-C-methyltransferase
MPTKISRCRICGNQRLKPVLDLGEQALTGVFPRSKETSITSGPLRLVKCEVGNDACGLLQLEHSYDLSEMYGLNYGYRSGLNSSMVRHLYAKVGRIRDHVQLARGDLVIDIGSNDGTTLGAYGDHGFRLVGVDPTGVKFQSFYPPFVELIADFFSAQLLRQQLGGQKAKVVTSFSMFYDLEDPLAFMRDVYEALADDGIWVFEQSYMPRMLETNSFDTVCHEHLEYYALRQICWMTDRVGFRIVDVDFNDVNGGSFSVSVRKARAGEDKALIPAVERILAAEAAAGLDTLEPYLAFAERVAHARRDLLAFLGEARAAGKTVAALGASTKGNVVLQYCDIDEGLVATVGEVNPEKFAGFTPGTLLPIVPEEDLLATQPDYLLVLPWHFRDFFCNSAVFKGRTLVFPLPRLEIVEC